jgi:hypothetical protein
MVQFSARSLAPPLAALFTFVTVLAFVLGTTTSGVAAGLNQFLLRKPPPVRTFLSNLRFFERAEPPLVGAPETGFGAKPPTENGIRMPGLVLPPYFQ